MEHFLSDSGKTIGDSTLKHRRSLEAEDVCMDIRLKNIDTSWPADVISALDILLLSVPIENATSQCARACEEEGRI